MATQTLPGKDVLLWLGTTNVFDDAKAVVCEGDSSFDGTRDVTTEDTKCELLKSLGSQNNKISGNGVVKINPDADQLSLPGLLSYYTEGTDLYAWYTDSDGNIFISGTGWLTQLGNQNTSGQFSKFSYNFEFQGDIDITQS